MSQLSPAANDLSWLVTDFINRVPGVAHAVVVSSDGLPLVASSGFPPDRADQLAAVSSGLIHLTRGASKIFEGGEVNQTIVEMARGLLLVMSISDGSCLAVLAAPDSDLGLVGYEMTLFVQRAGHVLTPAVRAELQTQRAAGSGSMPSGG